MDIARMLTWTADRYPGRLAVGGPRPLTWRQWDARTNQLARALADWASSPATGWCTRWPAASRWPACTWRYRTRRHRRPAVHPVRPVRTRLLCRRRRAERGHRTTTPRQRQVAALPADRRSGQGRARQASRARDRRRPHASVGSGDLSVSGHSESSGRPKGVPRTHWAESRRRRRPRDPEPGPPGRGDARRDAAVPHHGGAHPAGEHPGRWHLGPAGQVRRGGVSRADQGQERVTRSTWCRRSTGRCCAPAACPEPGASSDRLRRRPDDPDPGRGAHGALHPEVFVNIRHHRDLHVHHRARRPRQARLRGPRGRVLPGPAGRSVDPAAAVPVGKQGQVAVSMASPEAFARLPEPPGRRRPRDPRRLVPHRRSGRRRRRRRSVGQRPGRRHDQLGGENIYPDEIEAALTRCPARLRCGGGRPADDRWGQAVTAFLVPAGDFPPNGLVRLAAYAKTAPGWPRSSGPSARSRWTAFRLRRWARSCAASSPRAATAARRGAR